MSAHAEFLAWLASHGFTLADAERIYNYLARMGRV